MSKDPGPTRDYREPESAPAGPPFLEVVRGGSGIGALPMRKSIVFGRDPGCDARFPVEGVSRKHARMTMADDGTVRLVDLGSRNGTFLNGRRVDEAVLRGNDEIRMGPVVLRLRYAGETSGANPAVSEDNPLELLTPRERQIAQLVAEGLTNSEIAHRLSISPGTVGRHLANIYPRLGIHSRAALASMATRS